VEGTYGGIRSREVMDFLQFGHVMGECPEISDGPAVRLGLRTLPFLAVYQNVRCCEIFLLLACIFYDNCLHHAEIRVMQKLGY